MKSFESFGSVIFVVTLGLAVLFAMQLVVRIPSPVAFIVGIALGAAWAYRVGKRVRDVEIARARYEQAVRRGT